MSKTIIRLDFLWQAWNAIHCNFYF